MSFVLENLRIGRLIVHETGLAQSLDSKRPPKLSDTLTVLDSDGVNLIEERIVNALGSDSHSLQMDVEDSTIGSVFDLCTSALGVDESRFIEISKQLANKLTRAQTAGTMKAGIAVVFDGTVGVENARFAAVMKAETDAGFAKEIGKEAVLLHYLHDLVLGAQQRLYKIGCFVERGSPSGKRLSEKDFLVLVYDHLMSQTASRDAAVYFYKTFLGCRISETDKKLTKDFYDRTSGFINALPVQDQEKLELKNGLNAYLNSQKPQISVRDFSEDFFAPNVRAQYVDSMQQSGFPSRHFARDVTLIKSKLRQRRIKFSSRVRIVGPSENFGNLVKVVGKEGDWTIVHVAGQVEEQP